MSGPIRFGILGAARIAPQGFIQPASDTTSIEIRRIAARDPERARAFADEHGITDVSATYRDLIEADDIDVVYNPLPMSLHAEWTIKALHSGKHVLCEKPLASNAHEAQQMVDAAETTGMVLGEAFHYRYHPLFLRLLDLVSDGTIGDVQRLEGRFDIAIDKPNIRWSYDTSGGSLMDLGCYPMHWVRSVAGAEPQVVSAEAVADADDPRIDAAIGAELVFPSGTTAHIHSSMIDPSDTIDLRVVGTGGEIVVDNPLAPQNGNGLTITTTGGSTTGEMVAGNTYAHMLRAFVDHLRHGTPFPTQGSDAVANMAAIDAVYEAAGLPVRGT